MKTFSEALHTVAVFEGPDISPQRSLEMLTSMAERMGRIRDLLTEANHDPELRAILQATVLNLCCPFHAALSAFQIGLQVGMEMERSETGGIQMEGMRRC